MTDPHNNASHFCDEFAEEDNYRDIEAEEYWERCKFPYSNEAWEEATRDDGDEPERFNHPHEFECEY
jgi:hypothetical protein